MKKAITGPVALPEPADYSPRPSTADAVKTGTERGAAWLAHQSGGLGVVGSNPAAPTNDFKDLEIIWKRRKSAGRSGGSRGA